MKFVSAQVYRSNDYNVNFLSAIANKTKQSSFRHFFLNRVIKLSVKLWIMKIMYENCGVKNYMKEDHHSYRRNFCSLHNRRFVSQMRWTRHFLLSVNTCGRRWVEEPEQWTRNAWFNFTWNHAPPLPPQVHPLGFAIFFFIGGLFPTTGHAEKDNSPPPSSWSTTTYMFFASSFWSVQKQNDTFSQLLWMFSWVYRKKDNGCHNLVKTWTINLKMKTKKKNSVKRASLIEHFIGRLDQISLSLFVSKALYSFSYLKTI